MRESPSGKASAFQADIRGFESRLPLWVSVFQCHVSGGIANRACATGAFELSRAYSSVVEQAAHNRSVTGSIPVGPTFLLTGTCAGYFLSANMHEFSCIDFMTQIGSIYEIEPI